MQKQRIKNRKDENIILLIALSSHQKGLVFIMHGLGGSKEQPHIVTFADAFKEKGFTVVCFDTTNTFGESEGRYENATTTRYYEDLEDVIFWTQSQQWYQEPFYLAGHSLGGLCIIYYAEHHLKKVKALAPISTVISGKLSLDAPKYKGNDFLQQWKETGWRIEQSKLSPLGTKRLPWSHMEDRFKYDILEKAFTLTLPVLLIVGENDDCTPPEQQRLFYDQLPAEKELHIIKGATHTFKEPYHLQEIKTLFLKWIDRTFDAHMQDTNG